MSHRFTLIAGVLLGVLLLANLVVAARPAAEFDPGISGAARGGGEYYIARVTESSCVTHTETRLEQLERRASYTATTNVLTMGTLAGTGSLAMASLVKTAGTVYTAIATARPRTTTTCTTTWRREVRWRSFGGGGGRPLRFTPRS